jgi:hypothetical protein
MLDIQNTPILGVFQQIPTNFTVSCDKNCLSATEDDNPRRGSSDKSSRVKEIAIVRTLP